MAKPLHLLRKSCFLWFNNCGQFLDVDPAVVLRRLGWSVAVAPVGYFFGAAAKAAAVDMENISHETEGAL
jgi:hypothetical protein